MRRTTGWIAGLLVMMSITSPATAKVVACTEDDCPPGGGGGGTPPPVTTDVGVLPEIGAACPGDAINVYMDDEDDSNINDRLGWMGDTTHYDNTGIRFCKVSGSQFKALPYSPSSQNRRYAVLRLGTACPNGSVAFSRYFDNEDNNNTNSMSGTLVSDSYLPNWYSNAGPSASRLEFCLFDGSNNQPQMTTFPSLGFEYGVFAPADFVATVGGYNGGRGFIFTDDEDHNNENSNTNASTTATAIISSGNNTFLRMAKVRGSPARGLSQSDRVGDGFWLHTAVQVSPHGQARFYIKATCTNNVFGFTGGSFLVFVDVDKNPVWITSIQRVGVNTAGWNSVNENRREFTVSMPPSVYGRVRGAAVLHLIPDDTSLWISYGYSEGAWGWSSPYVENMEFAPDHGDIANRELYGWLDYTLWNYAYGSGGNPDYMRTGYLAWIEDRVRSTATMW